MCRAEQVLTVRVTKGKKSEQRLLVWPSGYSVLPETGGLLDQPNKLMELFDVFMSGERIAAVKRFS